ncbi:MAG: hypothetical protein A2015_06970 [Spirochaetes bacterium GWF1_31_7]|nr:MAG: hypothetical protein A2Y30_09490 [Spirochaetes bacterium GWE1_32_154]OHD46571.1 MAG: hypothetical protein A2015_06970 [Spirochaetes bacterium GWF1_31_7]OHD49378.1 MAG: hypothetical protein A2Y29_03975 [Spirochaetes bacterium GWE2_31_10]HBD93122.1 hypothetical protein [Spirochaetia bacterium]HBI36761.1 hypothetical protein [Spirochaetia bacterium]
MSKKIISISIFLFILFFNYSQTEKELFDKANLLFSNNKFTDAIIVYNTLLSAGYDNFTINYNLGYSYDKIGRIGKSVYHFEKAFYYSPFKSDTIFFLNKLNKQIYHNDFDDGRYLDKIILFIKPSIIFNILIILLCIIMIFYILYIVVKNKKFYYLFFFTMVILFLFSAISGVQYFRFYNTKGIITATKSADLFLSPYLDTIISTIDEGKKVTIEKIEGDFVQVKIDDLLYGWLNKDSIKIIKY